MNKYKKTLQVLVGLLFVLAAFSSCKEAKKGNQETVKPDDKAMLVSKVINILRREYGVVEEDRIREISLMVMNKIS